MSYPRPQKLSESAQVLHLFDAVDKTNATAGWGITAGGGSFDSDISLSSDSADVINGTQSLVVDWVYDGTGASDNDYYLDIKFILGDSINVTNMQTLNLLMNITGIAETDFDEFDQSFELALHSGVSSLSSGWGTATARRCRFARTPSDVENAAMKLGWFNLNGYVDSSLTPVVDGASVDLTQINGIRLRLRWDTAFTTATTARIVLDSLSMNARPNRIPEIAITFDDGNASDYTEAYDYIYTQQGYNFPCVSFVDKDTIDSNISTANQTTMSDAGWGFGFHGTETFPDQETAGTFQDEIDGWKAKAATNGWKYDTTTGSYPTSRQNQAVRQRLADNGFTRFRAGLQIDQDNSCFCVGGYGLDDPLRIPSLEFLEVGGSSNTVAFLRQLMDERVLSTGCDAVLTYHRIVTSGASGNDILDTDFQAQIDLLHELEQRGLIRIVRFSHFGQNLVKTKPLSTISHNTIG